MLGLFPDFPRGMGNLLRHHPLGLCDSHARKPSALVCLQQSFPAVDCCLGAVLFRGHAKSHCGNLYLSGVHLALSGAEWLHLLLLGGIIVVCLTLSCVIWQLRLNRIEKKKQGIVAEKEEPVSLQA